MALGRIRTVIVNTTRPPELAAFWSALLGVDVAVDDPTAGIIWLRPDTEGGTNLGFQRVDHPRSGRTETHVDVAVDDLDDAQRRIEQLGGRVVSINRLADGFEWRVVTDLDGNEFCIFVE